mgnify:CR=1 FL=1
MCSSYWIWETEHALSDDRRILYSKWKEYKQKGVEPDIEVEYQYDEADPKKDNQLDKALETVSEELK